jgi:cytoskeleton protein RodZ
MDIGAQLRTAREARGLSIGALAERTRVPARTLAAIERNDQSALPPHPFARGFVRTYAEEVDLDPDLLARDFFAQFPAPIAAAPTSATLDSLDESWRPPARWTGMGTAIAILLVVVAAAVVLGRRSDSSPGRETVGTTGASPAVPAPATPEARAATGAASPTTSAPSAAIEVVLSISRPCWVAATVDGRRTIYRTLQAGERETLTAERDIAIRFGDAGAVTWSINGRDAGRLGEDGTVRNVRVTPESAGTKR